MEPELDLQAYLRRIGFGGPAEPTLACLRDIHLAHAVSIPFENLDILLGKPIRLDLASLQDKLVAGGRGGYCFEHNTLFAAVLETLGFTVTRLAARVRFGRREVAARSHMLLRVEADGRPWLADVGFGGTGLLQPMPFEQGSPVTQFGWTYRLVTEGTERVLQTSEPDGWVDQYAFTLEPQQPIDYTVANHYTSTHPDSPFTRTLTAQRPKPGDPQVRLVLRGRKLIEYSPGGRSSTERISERDLLNVLADRFGLVLPESTRFP
jgi:N-hydroxyarylamine O-acetyltransferase